MSEREKVIKGLECCIIRDPDDKMRCGECPYKEPDTYCLNRLKMDALDLLNAKPRVMTKDEVMALEEGEVAWLEERFERAGKRFISPMMSDGKGKMMGVYAHLSVAVMRSRGRRFWTAKPTKEQMEETAWNN